MEPPVKKVAPAAINALITALTLIYWYKSDLRSFLTNCLSNLGLLSSVNWDDYKANIVRQLVSRLSARQDLYQGDLLRLMTEVGRMTDFKHLEWLEDGADKARK